MHRSMRFSVALCLSVLTALSAARSQQHFTRAGLSGHTVYSLAEWAGRLYAGTDNGVYVHTITEVSDTTWTPCGLQTKRVRAVYPHQSGAIGYALTAGIELLPGDPDSVLVYCSQNSDSAWVPTDEGIDHSRVRMIRSIDGFPSPLICGETYAASEGLLYRRQIGGTWEPVFDLGISTTNVVRVNTATISVWVGGETTIFAPFISRSDDKGTTWSTFYPDLQGDNACDGITFDPADTSLVYAGMEGSVIVSRNGGKTWESAGLNNTPFYFFGLAISTPTRQLYAGGAAQGGFSGLFVTSLPALAWSELVPDEPFAGIRSILALALLTGDVLLGTEGDGVIRYQPAPNSADVEPRPSTFSLSQNYPNPFNPNTTIAYTLAHASSVTLTVSDLLGRRIATLAAGPHPAGTYQVIWDASTIPSGVYVARLAAGNERRTITMLLVR